MLEIYSRDKNYGTYRTVVGRGEEEGPLCDPGSELLLGGREGGRARVELRDGLARPGII